MKETYINPDSYVTDIVVASWNKNIKDFQLVMVKRLNSHLYSLPGGFVNTLEGETAVDAARRILLSEINLDVVMFRHMAVFDAAGRDTRGYVISNVLLAIVEDLSELNIKIGEDVWDAKVFSLSEIQNMELAYDHKDMISKFKKIIDYDIYCQIFDTAKFGADFIVSLLGEKFTTSELIALAKWANREENITTFYRNIDNNYEFIQKEGRNKYYQKKTYNIE